ncbi:MAG: low molecular weight phosphotyrosine protein phosphatase [Armatimonadetes bacterium]|nr:low molecular weight phosphotyrosine protein phosphatase [Armatimonadota bacterium]MDE2206344.1 low molecular weight phosphotyrosine protein phosphatase [Armatimonadota bacterium]
MTGSSDEGPTALGVSVCFVCYGNICRSPMAQALFEDRVRRAGLDSRISADSAGTSREHLGEQPHIGTRLQLQRMGIRFHHTARPLLPRDGQIYAHLLALDSAILAQIRSTGLSQARLLMEYAPDARVLDVPDPWYTGDFQETACLVGPAVEGLLSAIRREHGW